MLTESLSAGCMGATGTLDGGGGRVMGDVSTLFVIESLEMYEFTNDLGFLQRLMPASLKSRKTPPTENLLEDTVLGRFVPRGRRGKATREQPLDAAARCAPCCS